MTVVLTHKHTASHKRQSFDNINSTPDRYTAGFTVLEVIVAIFIFGVITAALVKALGTADRIRGRAATVMRSVVIAQNEAEQIRNAAAFHDVPSDCTYTTTVNNQEFQVDRAIIQPEYSEQQTEHRLNEVELRFMQGYTW
jgi:prepilin-type N-terminal cleavage/methylation domain-containing protein